MCVRGPPHPEDGEGAALHGLWAGEGCPHAHRWGRVSCPSCMWWSRAAAGGQGWRLPSGAAVSRAFMWVGSWRPLDPLLGNGSRGREACSGCMAWGRRGVAGRVLAAGLWGQRDGRASSPAPRPLVLLLWSKSATPGSVSARGRSIAPSVLLTPFHVLVSRSQSMSTL